ncbi:MAG: integrase arm-type DNA-binding domain-containing protein [Proteobacteria bacterium]|nr:integrase arm-type DNA-binding domain-containing protein [Pseudomonadota bacterium]
MAREVRKLSARAVATIAVRGRHADGGGLYLVVDASGARRWTFRFRWKTTVRDLGLGPFPAVSLAAAREATEKAKAQLREGIDPIAARRVKPVEMPTFGAAADQFIEAMTPQFRNAKHVAQWRMTLTEYCEAIRGKLISEITTDDVVGVLKPLWRTKPETASRVRGRIERVLNAAKAQGFRTGENPAAWRGHLENLLPKRQKLTRGHHAALPYEKVPAFYGALLGNDALSNRALAFTILTAARSGEVREARWNELDLDKAIWIVPAHRMKAAREHRVPLSLQAVEIINLMAPLRSSEDAYVFPGERPGRPMSVMAMAMVLRRMKQDVTVHGFRSAFRDWAGEVSDFPREVAEAALAHVVGDATERAYRRGDALEKRRLLMTSWADFVAPQT